MSKIRSINIYTDYYISSYQYKFEIYLDITKKARCCFPGINESQTYILSNNSTSINIDSRYYNCDIEISGIFNYSNKKRFLKKFKITSKNLTILIKLDGDIKFNIY